MCRDARHHMITRNICICFAVYAVFGMKIPCGLFCTASSTSVAEHHLTALFTSITNGTTVDQHQLEEFLEGLHLSPPDHAHDEEHVHNETSETHCYSAEQMIDFFPNSQTLSKQQFAELLPTVVYELHTHACHHEHPEHSHSRALDWKAIVGSTVSVLVISISGLIVVALIPLMPRRFFNVISQFLIALSVGSLTGDAFLHLIPHALAPDHDHSHEDQITANAEAHNHHEMISKALVALLGIYAFFLTERLTILCQNNTSRRKMKRQRTTSHMENKLCGRPPDRPLDNARCADHLSELTSSERSTTTELPTQNALADASELTRRQKLDASHDVLDVDNRNGQMSRWKQNTAFAESNQAKTYLDSAEEQPTHPHRDKPHGHHHGHSHDLSSVRAIAYTVIVGDGLHNFCDGIAIGAAFSTNINGGLSTAIAVLCHELPHELGDFAVLLHAGMSVKAAIFYNLLSSILCAAGTVIGLLLGRIASIDTWIFMLTAGMFVYIALVDMMPELATNRLKGQRCCHRPSTLFIWQNVGILLGYGIMLLIAFYESQLA
ncbi:hypothetical protein CRM22_010131 [Opisthorchis felineus]|uniref:Zinc transporter ZIP4 N-terminal domain-containing protein n=1 Tax=Opisthorchis felineus TaxID=147828 RepID=A0A4S2L1Z2_OPIFE|nr:hypothetical protein CRM22_010131 [Opisthorchis felineus]